MKTSKTKIRKLRLIPGELVIKEELPRATYRTNSYLEDTPHGMVKKYITTPVQTVEQEDDE